jgi:mannitol/fructose-specific phosphotransferase system IIA component (Ntr-type)
MLQKYIARERIIFFEPSIHKQKALIQLMDSVTASDRIVDPEKFRNGILERENIMSTGIGLGIAVPHTYSDAVSDIVIAIGVSRDGISDYGSMDDKPVHFVMMVAAGSHQHREYLQILARIAMLVKNERVKTALLAAKDDTEIISALSSF